MDLKNLSQNWKITASSVKGEGDVDSVCVCVFFLHGGVVHHESSPRGHKVSQQYYLDVINHLDRQ